MVLRCKTCHQRARDHDGSCKNSKCAQYRAPLKGQHWKVARVSDILGKPTEKIGAYVAGGFILTLLHRHDIRVGVASGEYLRAAASGATAVRLELLAVVYLCYWRWSASSLLGYLSKALSRFERADSADRAEILKGAWSSMEADMDGYQVVGNRQEHDVQLVPRQDRKCIAISAPGETFAYHPYKNPASRRTGAHEFEKLVPDVQNGKLRDACVDLAELFAAKPTFRDAESILRKHEIQLWAGATYNRVRFVQWLFKAEGLRVPVEDKDWPLIAGMGSGAEEGLADAGIDSHEQVSIAQDLGLVAPVAAAGASAPSGETLCHARVRGKTAATPAIVSIAAWVLQEILRWVRAPAAGAICNCCRAWRAGGLFLACAVSERRRGVADSVASILSFDAKPVHALRDAGVSKSDVLRAWACAWDLLDGLPPRASLDFDERLLSMALVRMGVKEHLRGDAKKDAAALMFPDAGGEYSLAAVEKETLAAMECHVVMMMAHNDSGLWR
ncbi:unnamed protein product [Prorocentrum cordatum]|uniref:Uncharacterized protein n=1 Tax=Prorocentrum cordatum TaxID=2364126 RepID=A0ABN9T8H9_9DINO|nr:unnamed protein product [Polarella glacialis]